MPDKKKTRIRSTIDNLPDESKELINKRLADVTYTYTEISDELKEQGFEISKSAIGRYALRMGAALNRLKQANEQTKALIEMVKNNPASDYSEAGMQILADALTNKMAIAQEDIDSMPVEKAGRLMVALARTEVYRKKIKAELNKQYKTALEEIKTSLRNELQNEPDALEMLMKITAQIEDKFEELKDE